jgi:hypothetical protein
VVLQLLQLRQLLVLVPPLMLPLLPLAATTHAVPRAPVAEASDALDCRTVSSAHWRDWLDDGHPSLPAAAMTVDSAAPVSLPHSKRSDSRTFSRFGRRPLSPAPHVQFNSNGHEAL